MDNPTPTTPTPQPQPQPAPAQGTPVDARKPWEKVDLSQLSESDRQALIQLTKEYAVLKAAPVKGEEPWYWNDYAKGIYTGFAAAALIVGGVVLYRKYVGSTDAE